MKTGLVLWLVDTKGDGSVKTISPLGGVMDKFSRNFIFAAAIVCASALFCNNAGAATFVGSQVTGTLLFPDTSTTFAGPIGPVTVVDPGQEFPANSFISGRPFALDITASQIFYFTNESVTYGTGAFN